MQVLTPACLHALADGITDLEAVQVGAPQQCALTLLCDASPACALKLVG